MDFRIHYVNAPGYSLQAIREDTETADVVFADLMGADQAVNAVVSSATQKCKGQRIPLGEWLLRM